MAKRGKSHREKDLTSRFLQGEIDEDYLDPQQRFSERSAKAEQRKIERTALLRAAEEIATGNIEQLPVGQVVQVYSLFYDVEFEGSLRLCVMRKTLAKLAESQVVVGDYVRFRETGAIDEQARPEAVIEQVLPRQTLLTRTDSFNSIEQAPIVANAGQMLIVTSLREPRVKWGLVDRMIVAALAGKLRPIVCLNKVDLDAKPPAGISEDLAAGGEILAHYRQMGITAIQTSVVARLGLEELTHLLCGQSTVLAGHSGVGKSSLIQAIQPSLDLRIGAISGYTGKGRHTTTSARRYTLQMGGQVIDTPGVKLFGLWNVTRENLIEYFPDVQADQAPQWRVDSYQRIMQSLP